MNAKNVIAAVAMLVSTATAFAAEAPEATAAASATTASSAASAGASRLNLPTLGAPSHSSRDEVKAEAADFVKNYKSTLAVQLEQYTR
jgi:hypothetical protein